MSAKKRAKERAKRKPAAQAKREPFFRKHPNWTVVLGLVLLLFAFYGEVVFYNRTLLPPDTLASKSFQPFIREMLSKGEYPKWNPYIFSGMPSFASLNAAPYVDLLTDLFRIVLWIPAKLLPGGDFLFRLVNYFIFGLFAFLYLRKKGIRPEAGAFTALGLVLLPQVVAYAAFGHGTKLNAVALIPLILFLVDELLERRTLLLFCATALAVGLQLMRAHVQISYYTFLMIGLYGLWLVGWRAARRELDRRLAMGLVLVAGAILVGVIMSSWLYLSVYEYSHYSIRGGAQGGLSYSYATGWSFAPKEMLTFFIPSYFGFGGRTYWGPMPFTDFPMYFGVTVLFFAALALVTRRDHWTWFLFALAVFSLVVSFGRHLPVLYGPMFKWLPFFNKFRVPVMIQILMEISLLFLAGAGFHELLEKYRGADDRRVRYTVFGFAGLAALLFLVVLLGKSAILNAIAQSGKVPSAQARLQAYDMALRDALKMIALVGALSALVLAYLREKLDRSWLIAGALLLLVLDLWPVSHRLLDPQPKASEEAYFRPDSAVQFLKNREGVFRIFPVADTRPPNWYARHFLQNIYGYHAAKLRIYQAFLDSTRIADRNRLGLPLFLTRYYSVVARGNRYALEKADPARVDRSLAALHDRVLDVLNVRYLLSLYPFSDSSYALVHRGKWSVVENTDALPRAFLVDSVMVVRSEAEAYRLFRSPGFDPRRVALLFGEPELRPRRGAGGTARVVSFSPHRIVVESEAEGAACLVLSEVYYPAGWKAYVDGQRVPIHRADLILRALMVPAGKHKVELVFDPWTFKVGLWVTVGTTLLLLAAGGFSWARLRQRF